MFNMKYFSLLLLLLFSSSLSWAQDKLITVEKRNLDFPSFIKVLSEQSGYVIYYNYDELQAVKINSTFQNQSLEHILQSTLPSLNRYYAIDSLNKKVFITEIAKMHLNLFFDNTQDISELDMANKKSLIGDLSEIEKLNLNHLENRVYQYGTVLSDTSQTRVLTGYITSLNTGNQIPSAIVSLDGLPYAVETNALGFYSLVIPKSQVTLKVNVVGKQETKRQLLMYESGRLDIELTDEIYALNEVVISADRGANVRRSQMGLEKVSVQTIKQAPSLLGEADVVRVLLTLPGVQSAGESSGGFNVRGGSTDQNLILFNDATIFNTSHLFGFFSAFNADVIQEVQLYKSGFPAKYGGRISSVLEILPKFGNKKKISGSGGIGLLTSRLSLDGPIGSKSTFLLSGRSTYSDWLLNLVPDEDLKKSSAKFYDMNLLYSYQYSPKDVMYFTAYSSSDKFSFRTDTAYSYQNYNFNFKWDRILDNFKQQQFALGMDRYDYSIQGAGNPFHAFNMDYSLHQYYVKLDYTQRLNSKHNFSYGFRSNFLKNFPGNLRPTHAESQILEEELQNEQALETSLYFNDQLTLNDNLSLDLGIRYTMYNYLGSKVINEYSDPNNRNHSTFAGTKEYGNLALIKTYHLPEIRVSSRYVLGNANSIKASFNTISQNLHLLSNTTSITPTDSWKLSDKYIKPQKGYQVSFGYYHDFSSNTFETSWEIYYKDLKNYLDYKSGASLVMNSQIEADVINTEAKAYGAEVSIKKQKGQLNGWISYSYSRVLQRTNNVPVQDLINKGEFYPSNYDKPHNLNLVLNYKVTHRLSFSVNSEYSTGRPITLPIGQFTSGGNTQVYYSDRNQYRVPDYFRTDASINIEGNHKSKKLAHSSWSLGVYNVMGRKNPYSIYYKSDARGLNGYQLSIFGHQIPFITYNFKF